jgi:YbbR domain-containing protein
MSTLRSVLFGNLGLKLVALLLALLVYFNVYTDRPTTMLVSFPIRIEDLPDSLSLSGPAPAAVQAELRGTGKQLLRLRLTEPPVRVSLAGAGSGRFERQIAAADLPLESVGEVAVERVVGPRMLELEIERRITRHVRVAAHVEGRPATGSSWDGSVSFDPTTVVVRGPRSAVAALDSVRLSVVRIEGRRDTVRADVAPAELPDWCEVEPAVVRVTVPITAR